MEQRRSVCSAKPATAPAGPPPTQPDIASPPCADFLAIAPHDSPRRWGGGAMIFPPARARNAFRVFVVENNPGDAGLIACALLESPRTVFATAQDATLAAAEIRLRKANEAFDPVLLDLSLPDSFGLQTISHRRRIVPALPIVVMTGLDDDETAETAVALGAQTTWSKAPSPDRCSGGAFATPSRARIFRPNAKPSGPSSKRPLPCATACSVS